VDPGDREGLLRAVERLLEDPALASRMGSEGRRHIEQLYSVEAAVLREEGILQELAGT
jgi:glycosyltransferase involved in cell wall biosynthesis